MSVSWCQSNACNLRLILLANFKRVRITKVNRITTKEIMAPLGGTRSLNLFVPFTSLFVYLFFVVCLLGGTWYLLMNAEVNVTKMIKIKEMRE